MTPSEAKRRFSAQREKAGKRGIPWELTFEQWVEFWGDDLKHRGSRRGQLVMCRVADEGAYRIGNIFKGSPKRNARTRSACDANERSLQAKRDHEAFLDSLISQPSRPPDDEADEDQIEISRITSGSRFPGKTAFLIDKR